MRFPYEHHFLVCTGPRCCEERKGKQETGDDIRSHLKSLNKKLGRKKTVRVCAVSCLDLCDYGPNMVVWPEGDVFSGLDVKKAVAVYRDAMGDPDEDDSDVGTGLE